MDWYLVSMRKDTKNFTKWESIWWDSLNSIKILRRTTFCCHKVIKIFTTNTQRLVTIFNSKFKQRDKFVLIFSSKIWVLLWMEDTLTVIWRKNGLKRIRLNWLKNKLILCCQKKLSGLLWVRKNKPKFHTKIYRPSDKNLSKEDSNSLKSDWKGLCVVPKVKSFNTRWVRFMNPEIANMEIPIFKILTNTLLETQINWICTSWKSSNTFTITELYKKFKTPQNVKSNMKSNVSSPNWASNSSKIGSVKDSIEKSITKLMKPFKVYSTCFMQIILFEPMKHPGWTEFCKAKRSSWEKTHTLDRDWSMSLAHTCTTFFMKKWPKSRIFNESFCKSFQINIFLFHFYHLIIDPVI